MARQYGIEHSTGTFITFLDTGDYFYEGGLELILKQIQEDTYTKMRTYSYVYTDKNILADKPDNKTIGIILCHKNNKLIIKYCSNEDIISREYVIAYY